MPAPKKGSGNRSAGTAARVVAENPYATPDPGPDESSPRVPVSRFILPPAAPMPVHRAHGHVLTERGWVREEGNTHG